ncbi:global transcription factor [Cucumis melo var. makuwa]|uniref:Global transcription factor n=1 Tax=Cucumis melo var. makuwa TaxID=1194695 RepID=A0A5D3DLG2_CUCMM|nr:global transcription factor [Cucumis melo var. makuwa]TYK24455.1 global transcription factor [Cucumis melo var. makuwa]
MYCIGKASPDRLYRAVLLKNRFTDTILKAQEKALEKKKLCCKQRQKLQRMLGGRGSPDALLTASGKPRPFPTQYLPFPMHTYGVGKT